MGGGGSHSNVAPAPNVLGEAALRASTSPAFVQTHRGGWAGPATVSGRWSEARRDEHSPRPQREGASLLRRTESAAGAGGGPALQDAVRGLSNPGSALTASHSAPRASSSEPDGATKQGLREAPALSSCERGRPRRGWSPGASAAPAGGGRTARGGPLAARAPTDSPRRGRAGRGHGARLPAAGGH